jgi:chromatin remodeling complex protein RSC6
MVRTTKAEKQTVAPVAPAPVENVVVEAAAPKKTKKAAAKAEAAPVVAAPVPAPEPEQVATESAESTIFDKLAEYGAKIQQVSNLLSTLKSDYKTLEKVVVREIKAAQKSSSRRKKTSSGNRAPSGFVKPAPISDELAKFLGKTSGTEMARVEVSKEINAYIKSHNLKDQKNGRIIHPDSKLTVLLNVKPGEQLTYFNLQKYMKHHFIKKTADATA